jgi:hypothetical protein
MNAEQPCAAEDPQERSAQRFRAHRFHRLLAAPVKGVYSRRDTLLATTAEEPHVRA